MKAEAVAGRGGSAVEPETGDPGGFQGGAPGSATASAHGESSGGGDVSVTAVQVGGDGGSANSGANGTDGAESSMFDAVTGSTSGHLFLRQEARAGHGGSSTLTSSPPQRAPPAAAAPRTQS